MKVKQSFTTLIAVVFIFSITLISCKPKEGRRINNSERPPKSEGRPEKGGERPSIDELFSMRDENNDNKLSKTEVSGPLLDDFTNVDTNKDGFLSKEEVENGAKRGPKR